MLLRVFFCEHCVICFYVPLCACLFLDSRYTLHTFPSWNDLCVREWSCVELQPPPVWVILWREQLQSLTRLAHAHGSQTTHSLPSRAVLPLLLSHSLFEHPPPTFYCYFFKNPPISSAKPVASQTMANIIIPYSKYQLLTQFLLKSKRWRGELLLDLIL